MLLCFCRGGVPTTGFKFLEEFLHLLLESFLSPPGIFALVSAAAFGFFLWPKAKSLLLSAYKRDYVSQQNTTAAWKKVQWELLKIDSKSTSSSSFFGQLILHGLFLQLHDSSLIPKNQTSNSDEIMIDFNRKFHFCCTVITLGSLFWFCTD